MKRIVAFLAFLQLVLVGGVAFAQSAPTQLNAEYSSGARTVLTESWVEEWDPVSQRWVRVEGSGRIERRAGRASHHDVKGIKAYPTVTQILPPVRSAARFARPKLASPTASSLAQYGPFMVLSPTRAALVGSTNRYSPAHFDAMLRDFPHLALLELVEAPGTSNDIANLAVGRRIREAGIATHVPGHGSVRSGAVELFLAGAVRSMEEGAQFAVHSWLDNYGREASDLAADHPAHRLYLDYYVEMGMSEARARDFYDMTNSVPHHSALWLEASHMRPWLRQELPVLAYVDLSRVSLVDLGARTKPVMS